jgi:hypothetical protein
MEMPALLPTHLYGYSSLSNDDELYDLLIKNTHDLILFFEYAADDETWSEEHSGLMAKLMTMFTNLSYQNKLEMNEAKKVQHKIQQHYKILNAGLPQNVVFEVDGNKIPGNSLLFSVSSSYFHEYLWKNGFLKDKVNFRLDDTSLVAFKVVEEFVKTGEVPDLWKFSENELKSTLEDVNLFGLTDLNKLFEEILSRYITRENVLDMLLQAHSDKAVILRHACYNFINALHLSLVFHPSTPVYLKCEFLDFNENSLNIFNGLKGVITHLKVGGNLSENPQFSTILKECPRLIQLNLSQSKSFNEIIFEIKNLSELDLSSCNWLTAVILKQIVENFYKLKMLNLSDNIQLDYSGWGALATLKELLSLDISRNSQINDDTFKLILQSCPQLTDLNSSECKKVGDKGFFEISRCIFHIMFLNLENCHISDGILIEIAFKARFLEEINLNLCTNLTDRGILELTKQSSALKKVHLKGIALKHETSSNIMKMRPYLKIITDSLTDI